MLASYDVDDPRKVAVVGEGSGGGGLAECLSHTSDDRVYWGGAPGCSTDVPSLRHARLSPLHSVDYC